MTVAATTPDPIITVRAADMVDGDLMHLGGDNYVKIAAVASLGDGLLDVTVYDGETPDPEASFMLRTDSQQRVRRELATDLHARLRPSDIQMRTADAMLTANPDAYCIVVPLALPGKRRGVWTATQTVDYPPGYFLARTNDWNGAESYAAARAEADMTARRHMAATVGVSAYATIDHRGDFAVFECAQVPITR